MKKNLRAYALLFCVAGLIVALDQWTKYLVRTRLAFMESWSPWEWLAPYARIVHWNNTGAAFGLFQGFSTVFMVLAIVVALAIIYYFPTVSSKEWVIRISLCMQLGGAVGNLVDRFMFNGKVTDFISLGNFAVFNIADASISVGVTILLLVVLYKDFQEKSAKKHTLADRSAGEVINSADSEPRQ